MISTLAIDDSVSGAAVLTSRSTDGGLTWQNPVTTSLSTGSFYDKNWITCDTWAQSPHYGNCYQEWDDTDVLHEHLDRRRPDLGPEENPGRDRRRRPAGRPAERERRSFRTRAARASASFRSTDGGATWQTSVPVASVSEHGVAGEPPHVAAALGRGRRRRARSTSPGRTAASARAAPRTTSSTAPRWTASPGRPSSGSRSTRRTAASTTSSPGSRSTARHPGTARGSRSATTTTRSPPAARARAS